MNPEFNEGRRSFLKKIPALAFSSFFLKNLFASEVYDTLLQRNLDGLPDVSNRNVEFSEGNHLDKNVMYIEDFYIDGKKSGTIFFEKPNTKWRYIGKRPFGKNNEDRMSPKSLEDREEMFNKKIHLSVRGPFVGTDGNTEGYSIDPHIDPSALGEYVKGNKANVWDGFVVIKNDGTMQIVSKNFLEEKVYSSNKHSSLEEYLQDMIANQGHSLFQAPLLLDEGKPGLNDSALENLVTNLEKKKQLGFYKYDKYLENYLYLAEFSNGQKGVIHFNNTDMGILEQTAILQQKFRIKNAVYLDSHLQGMNIGRYRDKYGEKPIGKYDFGSNAQIQTGGILEISY